MKIKSYFARTVEDAMAAARQELGPDAMLMNSRKTAVESRHLGEYEAVFATLAPGAQPATAVTTAAAAPVESTPFLAQPFGERLSTEVAELKRELEGMRRTLTRSAFAAPQWMGAAPDFSDAYAVLTGNDVAPDLAREIVQGAAARLEAARPSAPRLPHLRAPHQIDAAGFQRALLEELESRFQAAPTLGKGTVQ